MPFMAVSLKVNSVEQARSLLEGISNSRSWIKACSLCRIRRYLQMSAHRGQHQQALEQPVLCWRWWFQQCQWCGHRNPGNAQWLWNSDWYIHWGIVRKSLLLLMKTLSRVDPRANRACSSYGRWDNAEAYLAQKCYYLRECAGLPSWFCHGISSPRSRLAEVGPMTSTPNCVRKEACNDRSWKEKRNWRRCITKPQN